MKPTADNPDYTVTLQMNMTIDQTEWIISFLRSVID